jgi:hypothetical protein
MIRIHHKRRPIFCDVAETLGSAYPAFVLVQLSLLLKFVEQIRNCDREEMHYSASFHEGYDCMRSQAENSMRSNYRRAQLFSSRFAFGAHGTRVAYS